MRSSAGDGITIVVPSLFRLDEGRVHDAPCISREGKSASEPRREVSRETFGSEGGCEGLIFNDFIFFSIEPWCPCAMFGVESFWRVVECMTRRRLLFARPSCVEVRILAGLGCTKVMAGDELTPNWFSSSP